jgi:hypothetical protein
MKKREGEKEVDRRRTVDDCGLRKKKGREEECR